MSPPLFKKFVTDTFLEYLFKNLAQDKRLITKIICGIFSRKRQNNYSSFLSSGHFLKVWNPHTDMPNEKMKE